MELISKEEAKREITKELDSIDHVPRWVFRRLEGAISSLPTIEEREEGYWVYYINQYFICSNCGAKVLIPDNGSALVPEQDEYRFCPVCGAHMKGL